MLVKEILSKEYGGLKGYHSGELVNRVFSDMGVIKNGIMSILPSLIGIVVSFVGAAGILIAMDWHFVILMLVGGSSGSTAGGLKTVTFVVMLLFMVARARGRSTVCVYKRTIPQSQVMDAMTIAFLMVSMAIFGGIFISSTSSVSFTDALYEATSAIATVGLTAGVTGNLTIPGQILIILYMYFGRVGVLTISMGFLTGDRAEERFRYAQTNLLIG
jgi:trk system potassium uptake protein TrkH